MGLPWIFLSPIFYNFGDLAPLQERPWAEHLLHYANPVAPFIISIQDVLFWGRWPFWGDVAYSFVAAAALLALGWFVFAAVHNIQPNVPPANLVAMWETWREEASYG